MTFCLPVTGNNKPGVLSEVRWCNLCAQEIWVAESSLAREATELVCIPCGLGVMTTQPGQLAMDDATRRELMRLGYSAEEVERIYQHALRRLARREGL
jgi:hypothetical protein